MMQFYEMRAEEAGIDPVSLFGKVPALLTVECAGRLNTMTVGWGSLGVMWGKPVATVAVRPERYTYGLLADGERFSVSSLDENQREVLGFCGRVSGRDTDKIAACGLHPAYHNGTPYFEEARLVLICRKLCTVPLSYEMLSQGGEGVARWYGEGKGAPHTLFFGEVETVLKRKTI